MATQFFDFKEENGLVDCKNPKPKNNSERLYLQEAKELGVDAILFRRFYREEDNKEPYKSEPAVCIFNKEDDFINSDSGIALHAKIWSAGKNDIYIINTPTICHIINARKPTRLNKKSNKLVVGELIPAIATKALSTYQNTRFSAYLFGSGTFWEQTEFSAKIDEKDSPYVHLLNYLKYTREQIVHKQSSSLKNGTIYRILVICILVKFLEEITDDCGKHTLRDIYKKYEVESFEQAISQGLFVNLLEELANEFNGKIFDKFTAEEKAVIANVDLLEVIRFLRGDVAQGSNQLFFWQQYSFKHLPPEVISAIYEYFIQVESYETSNRPEKGVVYTPVHLVNLLVDEVMPLDKPELLDKSIFKVLDPACGSGVFLVAAYKRMLQWWAINNSNESNIRYPDRATAQKLMEDNIFGVDVNKTAAMISVFALTIALLDKLTPKEIWNNLKFQDLSQKNISDKSFFDWAVEAKKENLSFDLVIGNPPFNVENSSEWNEKISKNVITSLNFNSKKIPDHNLALHFFEGALLFGKKVCMVLPSNVLLYRKADVAIQYRINLFTNYNVHKLFDFTHLRRILFNADTPVVAITLSTKPCQEKPITHIVVKRTVASEIKQKFEIDLYDTHIVHWKKAVNAERQFIWKTNLLGGGQLYFLIGKLSLLRTFEEFINEKKEANNKWTYGVGYKVKDRISKLKYAEYISNKDTILTDTFDINEKFKTVIEKNKQFAAPRDELLYTPPHLIFKTNIGSKHVPIHFSNKYVCFKAKLIGLHAPIQEINTLKEVYNTFISEQYSKLQKTWILATSAEALINLESACKKEDIDTLPYPEDKSYLILSPEEQVIQDDVLNYYIHLGKSINKGAGSIFHEDVTAQQLLSYGKVYCNAINAIYAKNGKSLQIGAICKREKYTIYQFGFGKDSGLNTKFIDESDNPLNELFSNTLQLDAQIEQLAIDALSNSGTIYQKIIRIDEHIDGYDCFIFIKPNAVRYWLDSIALRDASFTYKDLRAAGF